MTDSMLATKPGGTGARDRPAQFDMVTFQLGGELLAIDTSSLREVIEPGVITRVPNAPGFANGLLNVRGSVVPLSDLRIPLRMTVRPPDEDTRILVLDLDLTGTPCVVGMLAEKVHEVTQVASASLEDVPAVGARWPRHFVSSVGRKGDRFFIIPDLAAIFATYLGDAEAAAPKSV